MPNIPERWAEQAEYDFDTARAMLDGGRYLYVLFCCQQAVEKMLKGVIVKRTSEFPPRSHNLTRLVEVAGIALDAPQADILGELTGYYIHSRYPEELEDLAGRVTRLVASETLRETAEALQWLKSMIA